MRRSGVPDGCHVTVMSAPCCSGVFTPTFSRTSRNTHVSFTPGRSTPFSLETFCEVNSVSSTGLTKLSRSHGRSRKILESHSKDHLDGELGALGRRSEWRLRIRVPHGLAYRLPPCDGPDPRWVATHLNPPRVRPIIALLVNCHPPGRSAPSKGAIIARGRKYG